MRGNARQGRVQAVETHDVLVIGSGVGGLTVALETPGLQVGLLTKTGLGSGGSSPMAQGGVAAAVGPGDSPAAHAEDTLAAAAGLAVPESVRILTEEAPARVAALLALGTRFDRDGAGDLALGREAAHGVARILHANGDTTGAEIVRALRLAVESSPTVEVFEHAFVCELVRERGRVVGVLARHLGGVAVLHLARAVVLATGGIGHVYRHTTNPRENTGDGLAMAARAGARLADLEFVQFHPTALDVGADPMPLLTEALRGAGATLVDDNGERIMTDVHPDAELASRDVVARALWETRRRGRATCLDARHAVGDRFAAAFPTALRHCLDHGFDPRLRPVPVSPAAHYHMGGVAVDTRGRTSLAGLWACGEVSCVGVHGANRLASNSLLDALVFGARVGRDLMRETRSLPAAKALVGRHSYLPGNESTEDSEHDEIRGDIRDLMWRDVGLVRTGDGLRQAVHGLIQVARRLGPGSSETHNLLTVAGLVAQAALARRDSRGAHYRADQAPVSGAGLDTSDTLEQTTGRGR